MQLLQEQKEFSKVLSKMIAQSWCDPAFKQEFINNPQSKFAEQGVVLPEGVNLQVDPSAYGNLKVEEIFDMANSRAQVTYTIPLAAKPRDIADEDLTVWGSATGITLVPGSSC